MTPDPTRRRAPDRRWTARNNPGRRATDRTRAGRAGRRVTDPALRAHRRALARAGLAGLLSTVDLVLAFLAWYGAPMGGWALAAILAGNALAWLAVAL